MSSDPISEAHRLTEHRLAAADDLDRIAHRLRQGAIAEATAAKHLRDIAVELDGIA